MLYISWWLSIHADCDLRKNETSDPTELASSEIESSRTRYQLHERRARIMTNETWRVPNYKRIGISGMWFHWFQGNHEIRNPLTMDKWLNANGAFEVTKLRVWGKIGEPRLIRFFWNFKSARISLTSAQSQKFLRWECHRLGVIFILVPKYLRWRNFLPLVLPFPKERKI